MDKCNTETLELLEQFVRDMGATADAYTTLGGTYLNCDDYPNARKRFNDAIELAKPDDEPNEAGLVAEYGLVVIDFLEKKIDRDKWETKTKEIKERLDRIPLSKLEQRQCNCIDPWKRPGRRVKNLCIAPCP